MSKYYSVCVCVTIFFNIKHVVHVLPQSLLVGDQEKIQS